jgi:hypothetical protein
MRSSLARLYVVDIRPTLAPPSRGPGSLGQVLLTLRYTQLLYMMQAFVV